MQFFAFLVFLRLSPAFLNISTFPPDFAKGEQICLFFQPIRFVPQTGFHIQHRRTKYFSNLAKVLHIFSALLFVFQNIFNWILFIGCKSFLCPIFLEVLCWFWGKFYVWICCTAICSWACGLHFKRFVTSLKSMRSFRGNAPLLLA